VRAQLARGGFLGAEGAEVGEFPDLDRGLHWCEDRLLLAAGVTVETAPMSIRERLERVFRDRAAVDSLLGYFERREVAAGTHLMRLGEPPDDGMFVLESGQVSAQLEIEGEQALRLRTMGPGSVLGEIELYLETPRAASVVAETPCVIWRISAASLLHLKEADPTIAARFHFYMCRILAGRLAKNHELLRTLLK
jgi:SulP family sulfate permease